MDIIADLHVHTVASGHAFSTIREIVSAANEIGLKILGISDHGPCVDGAPSYHYFRSLRFLPRHIDDVLILRGAEANIISESGDIDVPEHCLEDIDYTMAGFHVVEAYNVRDKKINTKAMIRAMDNPYVKVITHPGNPKFPVDYEEIVAAAKDKGVALEINNASFVLTRAGSEENCAEIARLIKKYDAYTIIGSDAHFYQDVGVFDSALKVALDAGISETQVINTDRARLFDFLGIEI